MTTFILLTNLQIGLDSAEIICPILLCDRWGSFQAGTRIIFRMLTYSCKSGAWSGEAQIVRDWNN